MQARTHSISNTATGRRIAKPKPPATAHQRRRSKAAASPTPIPHHPCCVFRVARRSRGSRGGSLFTEGGHAAQAQGKVSSNTPNGVHDTCIMTLIHVSRRDLHVLTPPHMRSRVWVGGVSSSPPKPTYAMRRRGWPRAAPAASYETRLAHDVASIRSRSRSTNLSTYW